MAINLDNINSAFSNAKVNIAEISKISHSEQVPVSLIRPSEYNPYNQFDGENDNEIVRQLADSINVQGLIEPIVLNKINDNCYIILSGERRYKAVMILGWKYVPAQVYNNLDDITASLILHSSNLEVREYTSGQKLIFYKDVKKLLSQMKDNGQLTGGMQKAISNMLNVNERQVRKYERICNELSEDEQAQIIDNDLSINEGYKIAQQRKNERKHNEQSVREDNKISDSTASDMVQAKTELTKSPKKEITPAPQTPQTTMIRQSDDNSTESNQTTVVHFSDLSDKETILNFYKGYIPTVPEAVDFLTTLISENQNNDFTAIDREIREHIRTERNYIK